MNVALRALVVMIASLSVFSADAASGLERYFPYSITYNDARITVRASDRSVVELLLQAENPHLPNPTGRDGTRRSYFLNTTTSSRDIAGLFIEFADPQTNLQVGTVNLVYETTEGLTFDCYNPTAFGRPLVRLATPMSLVPVPSTNVERAFDCFTAAPMSAGDATFDVTTGKPSRLLTLDGSELDVVDVALRKNGANWRTWHFAYNLGLVGITSSNPAAPFGFQAVSVPPPMTDGVVVEFWNAQDFAGPGGHYFYTTDPVEQRALETGRYGSWARTGRSFNSGGYVSVCRFYGSVSPGPNSHFFTANGGECAALQSMQKPNATTPQWNFESLGFAATLPRTGGESSTTCMNGTTAVRRAYNNAYSAVGKNPWDSNHRLTTSPADIDAMVKLGWKDEGVVFCAPL